MQVKEKIDENSDAIIKQMFEAGMHYGYSKTRRHPSVASCIYTTKNKTDIIDLEKTKKMLDQALEFVKTLGSTGKIILMVGTKPGAQLLLKNSAEILGMPYVIERWIGGTLTNFSEIKKRIAELEKYRKDKETGELEKYTKKERLLLSKKMEKLTRYYGGLINLKKIPDALFIIDPKEENIANKEAQIMKLPVIALANSDSDIKNILYPIIGNDASMPAMKFFTDFMVNAYTEGKKLKLTEINTPPSGHPSTEGN
jgi:small subunit ribosomal protein S2